MEFLMEYHLAGIVIGVATFLIIGIFHPCTTCPPKPYKDRKL